MIQVKIMTQRRKLKLIRFIRTKKAKEAIILKKSMKIMQKMIKKKK